MPPPSSPWADPQVVATVIAAVATVVYVVVTIGILRVTSNSTRITQKIFEANYRPYVFIKSITCGLLKRDQRIRVVFFEVANAGSVPADGMRYDIFATKDGQRVPANIESASSQALFPKESFVITFTTVSEELTRSWSVLHFSVQITYQGTDKQKHGYSGTYRYDQTTDFFVPLIVEFH